MLTITIRNRKIIVPDDTIYYIESSSRRLIVHTYDQTYIYYQRLDNAQNELPMEQFIRIHKSYLVAKSYIKSFTNYKILLKNGIELPISATYKNSVKVELSHNTSADEAANNSGITGSLICIRGTYKNSVIRMYSDQQILIGRDEHCDICYNLPFISRKQCILIFHAKRNIYEIIDYSTNGTYIVEAHNNISIGRPISSSRIPAGIPTDVSPGTILHFGDTDHLFQLA